MNCGALLMILAVDTNVLLDILIPDAPHVESSLSCLTAVKPEDELIICEAVFAELGSQFLSFSDLTGFLSDTGISLVPSNEDSIFEASRAWKRYASRKKGTMICPACGKPRQAVCPSCNEIIIFRQHILSDFLIGAHAKIHADRLITRDRGFYRKYFKGLKILSP